MVGNAGDAGSDHLRHAQHCPPINIFRGQVGFEWENDLVEPVVFIHVRSGIAEEHHRHVRVGVEHARYRQHAGCVDDLAIFYRMRSGGLNGTDLAAFDQDVLVGQKYGVISLKSQHLNIPDQQFSHILSIHSDFS